MALSREEKLQLMGSLNWDYAVSPEEMLAVIEGSLDKAGPFDRETLMLRSLERLSWHYMTALWGGVEAFTELYTPRLRGRIWPKERRQQFDFAAGILRGEPVSPPGWDSEYYKSKRHRFFSDRGNRAEQGVL
ncbi:MAG: hypothetical protein MdMp014T_2123 [Treponematales bacterium]